MRKVTQIQNENGDGDEEEKEEEQEDKMDNANVKDNGNETETYLSLTFLLNKFSSCFFLSFPTPALAAELAPLLPFPSFYARKQYVKGARARVKIKSKRGRCRMMSRRNQREMIQNVKKVNRSQERDRT